MSGHSKWANIKHRKGAQDAKRGAAFSKLARLVEVAARSGADPDTNFRLKLAIQKARAVNMPAANVDKAIRKGAELDKEASSIEEVTYEGIGSGNVAIIVQALTDNKNRTVSEVRNIFTKSGGNFGTPVGWQFKSKGVIIVPKGNENLELELIDAGAENIEDLGDSYEVHTDPKNLNQTKQKLIAAGIKVASDQLALVPTQTVRVADVATAKRVLGLIENLEDHDDVTEVFANFDIDNSIIQELNL